MSGAEVKRPWPSEPEKCRCARAIVDDLAETLDCPARWLGLADGRWAHILGGSR